MVLALRTPQQVKCPEALDLVEMRLTRVTHKSSKALRSSLITLKRFTAMNIFDVSKVRFFSTRSQLYRFLIGMPAILDNVSWSFSPKLQAL
jgi:hypothetical protein